MFDLFLLWQAKPRSAAGCVGATSTLSRNLGSHN